VNTFIAKERLYRTPDGEIVGEADVVDGSTLAAAAGDEFQIDEARALGLMDGKPRDPAKPVGEKEMTAAADAQRAKAAKGQLDQHEQLADQSTATDAQKEAALAGERARAEEAERTAQLSAARVSDLEQTVAQRDGEITALREQLAAQTSTFDASWESREKEHTQALEALQARLDASSGPDTPPDTSGDAKTGSEPEKPASKQTAKPADKQAAKPANK